MKDVTEIVECSHCIPVHFIMSLCKHFVYGSDSIAQPSYLVITSNSTNWLVLFSNWLRKLFVFFPHNRNSVIVSELAQRGHNVTVISPYTNKDAPLGAHYIPFGDEFQSILPEYVKNFMNSNETMSHFYEQYVFADSYISVCSGKCFNLFFKNLWIYDLISF